MPRMLKKQDDAASSGASDRAPEFLEVLARGLRVIDCFRDQRHPMTLSDVAAAVDIPRATARRALLTLVELGFVQSQGRLFTLTPRVLTLASAYLSSAIIPTVMQPIVERVSAQVGEACSAAVLDGDDVVFVARANPQRIISVGLEIGYRLPATSTAVGRVLLSGLTDAELDDHLRRADPKRFTAHTIVSRKALKGAILASRSSGYSIVDQEVEQGFRSLAVPVVDIHGRISCALHIGTHVVSTPPETTSDALLPTLQAAAKDASPMLL